jgi:hypothetical protein
MFQKFSGIGLCRYIEKVWEITAEGNIRTSIMREGGTISPYENAWSKFQKRRRDEFIRGRIKPCNEELNERNSPNISRVIK